MKRSTTILLSIGAAGVGWYFWRRWAAGRRSVSTLSATSSTVKAAPAQTTARPVTVADLGDPLDSEYAPPSMTPISGGGMNRQQLA